MLACILNFVLAILAVFRPNEFPLKLAKTLSYSLLPPYVESENWEAEIKLNIREYKQQRSLIIFKIEVSLENTSYIVKRSY